MQIVEPKVRNTPARSSSTTLGIFLFRSGISSKILATLFIIAKSSVRRDFQSIKKFLSTDFVPSNLGFQHITREDVINLHTLELAQNLMAERPDQVILVLDGAYIYIKKVATFSFNEVPTAYTKVGH